MGFFDNMALGVSQGLVNTSQILHADAEKEKARLDDLAKTQMNLGLQMNDQGSFEAGAAQLGMKGMNAAPHFAAQAASAKRGAALQEEQLVASKDGRAMQREEMNAKFKQWAADNGFRIKDLEERRRATNLGHSATVRGQDLNYQAQMTNAGLDYATSIYGYDTQRANAATRSASSGYVTDDQAKAIGSITNAVLAANPRSKNIADQTEETDEQYRARVTPLISKALAVSGLPDIYGDGAPAPAGNMPGVPGAPQAPGGGMPPAMPGIPAAPGGVPTPMRTPMAIPTGQAPRPTSTPAPPSASPGVPAGRFTPNPVPSAVPSFAPIAPRTVPAATAKPTMLAITTDYKAAFGKNAVSSVKRHPEADLAQGRAYDSYHHHWKAFDGTPAIPALEAAIQFGIDRGAHVLIEDDHVHYEPSTKGQGYVSVKPGDRGVYVDAFRALTGAGPRKPNGATDRIQALLKQTKPKQ